MAEWTDLSAGERQQAWAIFDSLRKRGPKTVDDVCESWAIPQKVAIRELSAMQANGMVVRCEETDAPMAWSEIRRRRYQANAHVRQSRYTELLEEWDGNFVDRDSVPVLGYDVDFDINRFVLVEDSTYGNGLWITVHETPTDAGSYHDSSEYPHDYDVKALIDLDTGDEYDAITDFDTDPAPSAQAVEDDPNLALWFTPQAIRDHFDGDPSFTRVASMSDAELQKVGYGAIGDDMLYRAFHEALVIALEDT